MNIYRYFSCFAVLLAAILLLGACSITVEEKSDAPRLKYLPGELEIRQLWYRQSQSGHMLDEVQLEFILGQGKLIFVDLHGYITALRLKNGRKLWAFAVPPDPDRGDGQILLSGGLGKGEGLILFGTREGEVITLSLEDGSEHWRAWISSEIISPPVIDGDTVAVHANDGRIFGLDAADGRRLWVFESTVPALSLRGTSMPVIHGRQVIVGLAGGKVVSLSRREGKVLWETVVAVPEGRSELERIVDIDGTPVVRDGVVYVAAYRGRVAALSIATGRILWARDMSSFHSVAVDEGQVYVADDQDRLWALDRRSGAVLWRQDALLKREITAPVLYDGTLVVGDGAGYVHWISKTDGEIVARHELSGVGFNLSPLVADGVLYLKDRHNAIFAISARRKEAKRRGFFENMFAPGQPAPE
ncbi:MAG TPA: outer membrane protein assembly factor BamB [Gammaproteobacteria bacterium]|nr:outer membrane protein assembly factor BamB [Gammaproteobacteria bacterium]